MSQEIKQAATLNKIQSIINFKELYYQERDKRIQLQKQLQLQKIKVKKLSACGRNKTRYCATCSNNLSSIIQIGKQQSIIDEFKSFSKNIQKVMPSQSNFNPEPSIMSRIQSNQHKKKHVGMIQNFTIFGINQNVISSHVAEGKVATDLQGEILFSKKMQNQSQHSASRSIFPSGISIKRYTNQTGIPNATNKAIQLMSYCYTNLKSFVLRLECPDSNFSEKFHKNDLLNYLNPDKRLFCICIGIHDYTWVQKKNKMNISLNVIDEPYEILTDEIKYNSEQGPIDNKNSNKSFQDENSNIQIGISQRVFCIMTYYPFFTFFEEVIRNLMNIVKMQRLAIYKHNQEHIKTTIKESDSKFQLARMSQLLQHCYKDLEFKKINFNKQYQLRLINQQKISLLTYWDDAKTFFIKQWIFAVLSMFSFQTFIDLLTLVFLEDKVIFICQNSHILTFTIYLFTHVLTKPLNYPYPVVSILPGHEQQYLNAPFPVVYGMLKKRRLSQEQRLLDNYDVTYVFLSPDNVQIHYPQSRKQVLNNRSSKLLNFKELRQMFKDLRKSRKKQVKGVKYQIESNDYKILASAEQKQRAVRIISIIQSYISEDFIKKLPSPVQLEQMRRKVDKKIIGQDSDEFGYVIEMVSATFKRITKDPFLLKLIHTQMVNNYLFLTQQ